MVRRNVVCKVFGAIITIAYLLFLPACDQLSKSYREQTIHSMSPNTPTISTEESPFLPNENHNAFPIAYYPVQTLKAGSLMCTVNDSRLVKTPPDPKMFTNDATGCPANGRLIRYPDFIQDNGDLIPGFYLLLVNMTVTSEDAVAFTRRDSNSSGIVRGQYDDPYVFRADNLLSLIEINMDNNGGIIGAGDVYLCYYSGLNQRAEHGMAFRLEPGKSIDFDLGFLVGDIQQGGVNNLENLYFSVGMTDNPDETLMHLTFNDQEALHS